MRTRQSYHLPIMSPTRRMVSPSPWVNAASLPGASSVAHPANARAYYMPFRVPSVGTVNEIGILIGTGVVGNVDVGIYTQDGKRLVSAGITAVGGASNLQKFTISQKVDTGLYYLGVWASLTTVSLFAAAAGGGAGARMMGIMSESTLAGGLPASWTPGTMADNYVPYIYVDFTPSESRESDINLPDMPMLFSASYDSMGMNFPDFAMNNSGSAAYPVANTAIFVPMRYHNQSLITKLASWNGGTIAGTNIDIGVYIREGNSAYLLRSVGGTAMVGQNTLQVFDITDLPRDPGEILLAVVLTTNTGALFRQNINFSRLTGAGVMMMASAYPLPAIATLTDLTSTFTYLPLIGALNKRTIL